MQRRPDGQRLRKRRRAALRLRSGREIEGLDQLRPGSLIWSTVFLTAAQCVGWLASNARLYRLDTSSARALLGQFGLADGPRFRAVYHRLAFGPQQPHLRSCRGLNRFPPAFGRAIGCEEELDRRARQFCSITSLVRLRT